MKPGKENSFRSRVGVRVVAGLFDVKCACNLESVALSVGVTIGAVTGTFDGDSTLGDGVDRFGSVSPLLSVSAIFFRTLRVDLLPPDLVLLLSVVL